MNKIYQKTTPDVKNRVKRKFGGFTLIELLVVVLIIGILAAIALPQYQRAVARARLAEALTRINAMEKAMDMYFMEAASGSGSVIFTKAVPDVIPGIDVTSGLTCAGQACSSKDFSYYALCDFRSGNHFCIWEASAMTEEFRLSGRKEYGGDWARKVEAKTEETLNAMKYLESNGWTVKMEEDA